MEGCRHATPADIPAIASLARSLRSEVTEIRGGPLWVLREGRNEPLEAAYEKLVDNPAGIFLVGTIDDVVLGFAVGELDDLHDGTRLGVVTDLYVDPEAREIGVGELMVDNLLEWFAQRECVGVDAWALPGDRATKNFFEDQGFVSRAIVVHRRLDTDRGP